MTDDERSELRSALRELQTEVRELDVKTRRLEASVQGLREELGGTSPSAPGIALRLDHIEHSIQITTSTVRWALGGGLVGLVTTLVIVWRIMEAMQSG